MDVVESVELSMPTIVNEKKKGKHGKILLM
jgi:hypothetical protein